MRRLLTFFSAAALLIAPLTPIGDASANAVSKYQTKSYRDGGVVLRMSAAKGSVLSPGEEISFTYQTSEDALVVLFNIDTEGYVHLLHPWDGLPQAARARETYRVPSGGDHLLVSGETGMEFVFALTVPDRTALDEAELAYLRDVENRPIEEKYRIDGDPFLAANIIAGELVRGISHRGGVFLDYTYFYVNQRVDHPCYLCGECEGARDALCDDFQLVADLERSTPLSYPLQRAYQVVERGTPASDEYVDVADRVETVDQDDDVNVSFYPYSVEVRYVTQPYAYSYYDPYWYDPFWYDPWYCGYVYYPGWRYPYYGHYYAWSFNWGYWGGYYCSGWYYPRYHNWRDYYHDNYWNYAYGGVHYKTAYKKQRSATAYKSSSDLSLARNQTVKRTDALRIGSKDLRRSPTSTRLAKSIRTSPTRTRSAIGKTTVRTRDGRSITTDPFRGRIRTKATSRVTTRPGTRSTKSTRTYAPRSRSTTHKGSAVNRGRTSSKPRAKSGSSSSRSRSKGSVKRSGNSRSNSKSSSVKRSSSRRSSSSSKSTSRSSSKGRSGGKSKGKRK
jgi:hypothetical protein